MSQESTDNCPHYSICCERGCDQCCWPEHLRDQWTPGKVGDLFMLIMPNKSKMLMRVTSITDATHWTASQASIDDAMTATHVPHYHYQRTAS